jgi:hypothetical protein
MTTYNAELAEHADPTAFSGFRGFRVDRRRYFGSGTVGTV